MKKNILFAILLVLAGCTPKRLITNKIDQYPMQSKLFSEIKIEKASLVNLLNAQIDTLLSRPFETGQSNLTLSRKGDFSVALDQSTLTSTIPLDIEASYGLLAKAHGSIILNFVSEYTIQEDWRIDMDTRLVGYEWTQKPKAKVLGISISVEQIANYIIDQVTPRIIEQMNDELNRYSDFRSQMEALMDTMAAPVLVDTARNLWLAGTLSEFGISPLSDDGAVISSMVYSQATFLVTAEEPTRKKQPLPPLGVRSIDPQKTEVVINGRFSEETISLLVNEVIIGMEVPYGKKKVRIEDVHLDFAGRLLLLRIKTSGAIDGYIDASGVPYMKKDGQSIGIDDFDIKMTGGRFLERSGLKLFKSKIKHLIEQKINQQLQKISTESIAKIPKNYQSSGNYNSFLIQVLPDKELIVNFEMSESSLLLQIRLLGNIRISLNHARE